MEYRLRNRKECTLSKFLNRFNGDTGRGRSCYKGGKNLRTLPVPSKAVDHIQTGNWWPLELLIDLAVDALICWSSGFFYSWIVLKRRSEILYLWKWQNFKAKTFYLEFTNDCLRASCHHVLVSVIIEHPENKIITQSGLFENEIRPGWIALAQRLANSCAARFPKIHSICQESCVGSVLSVRNLCRMMFVARWTGELQVQPHFQNT